MSIWEIICGVIMLIACIILAILSILQPPKQQNMSSAISGASSNFFDKSGGATREQALGQLTKVVVIVLFVMTLVVNIIGIVISK